ncbi:MAG: peptidylprolyl isomerase [Candidatus Puniceispirillales bacterium WSBS_2018_MAG_OTU23]
MTRRNTFFPRAIAITALMIVGIIATPHAQEDPPLTVLTIDGHDYSLNLVGSIINQLPDNIRSQPLDSYYDNVIDDIIDTKLSADAARRDGLADNPLLKEIAQHAMDRILADAWLNEEITRRISEDIITKSYNDLVADTQSRTEVRARHILVNTKDEAVAIITQLEEGRDFAELAIESSTGPSGANGGELGYFRRGAMVPSFEVASFNLEKGAFTTDPVQTQFGWHIIKVEDRRIAEAPSLESAREQLRNAISVKIAGSIITELRGNRLITQLPFEDVRTAEQARQEKTNSQ